MTSGSSVGAFAARRVGSGVLGGLLALFAAAAVGLASAHRPSLAVAAVLAVAVSLLVASDLAALPLVLALTMFVEAVSVAGIPVGRLAGVMALAVFGVHALTRRTLGIRPNGLLAVVAALGVWMLASSFWAGDSGLVNTTVLSYVLAVSYMLAFAALVRTRRQLVGVLAVIVVGSIVFGSIAFLAYAAGLGVGGVQEGRTQGFSGDPNYFAIYQVAALPAALVLAARETRPGRRLALYAGVVVIVLSVVSTLSRTGLVALALVVLATLLAPSRLFFRRAGQKAVYALTLAVAAGAAALAGSSELVARVQTILEPGADRGSGRTDLYAAALTGWHEHPWLGLGAGNFQAESLSLLQRTPGVNTEASYAAAGRVVHNAYLELLVELGPVGLALLALVILLTARCLLLAAGRARAAAEPTLERVSYAVLLSLFAFSVSAFFLSNQLGKLLWVTVGLALALDAMTRALSPVPVAPGLVGAPVEESYDLDVRERFVEQRERRIAGDFEAIRAERARLAVAEAERLEREGRLAERVRLEASAHVAEQARELERRERELEERIAVVTRRELAVARARAAAAQDVPATGVLEGREAQLERRERDLEARIAAVTMRELAVTRRHATLAARQEQPEPAVAPPSLELTSEPLPSPPPVAAEPEGAAASGQAAGAVDLTQLERLVEDAADAYPAERVVSWRYYLLYLRDYADYEGRLPAEFDALVYDEFAELLEPAGP